ncbi:hypothetical protein Lal_00031391 [Lupinus albus]|nr:hypothetical protein Lal_00031391 [Lupinus albus]
MASSSKRPRSSKSKQGESTSKSNPLNLTRLLANDAQRKVFEENFHGRVIFTPKYGNIGNFEFEDFLFPYLLRQQKLFDFCCEANDIYPELVRVFYCNMNFRKNIMTSHVKGKDIALDIKTFSSICCDIPMICDITGISKEEIERRKQQSLGETVKNGDILSAGYLTLEDRLIHYFLSYVILPKFSNHSQISDIELQLMYAIKFNIKINWAKMIMNQMWHVRGSQSLLPYAIFITKILEHFGVPLEGEAKVALNLRENKVDIEVVHKMGFVIDPVTRPTYKHCTDRQPSPTDEPEPTVEPNQLESHAQSSTSAAMPTNQMIMDEFAHNSKRKGEHTCIHIGGAYSRQVKIYHQTLVCHHQKVGDCEEDLPPDLGTVLMKTPISQKEERKKNDKDYRR